MNARILCLCLLLFAAGAVRGALIWHYRMDSFALLSDVVVLCAEEAMQHKTTRHKDWAEERTLVRCRVVRCFKGALEAGGAFEVEYGSLYNRVLPGDNGYTLMNGKNQVLRVVQPKEIPLGRALLFLKRDAPANAYHVVTAKLILSDGAVWQFGQFYNNPGGLELAPQKPENISLAPGQKYGEAELIQDLSAALEKAALLKAPVPLMPSDALK